MSDLSIRLVRRDDVADTTAAQREYELVRVLRCDVDGLVVCADGNARW